METFPDITTWLQFHGFEQHPFEQLVAEAEPKLPEYFEQFPFFEEVEKPKTGFLFLQRGTGKSANRVILERRCDKSLETDDPKLAVPYTDFYRLFQKEKVTLADHVEEILREAVPRLYEVGIKTDKIRKLPEEYSKDLIWFIAHYPHRLNPKTIKDQIQKMEGLSDDQKKEILAKLIVLPKKIFEAYLPGSQLAFDAVSATASIKEAKGDPLPKIQHSPLDLMTRFAEIACKLCINHIYILVDRVDEYAQIHDYKKTAAIVKSLIEAIPLLEMPRYALKFFLPDEIKSELLSHLRTDRFDVHSYTWKNDELSKIFGDRLSAYCDKEEENGQSLIRSVPEEEDRRNFIRLFEENFRNKNIINEMIQFSNHSPRNLLKLAKIIFDEHTRFSPIEPFISKATYEKALSDFAQDQISWRSQKEPSVKELGQIDLTRRLSLPELLKRDLNLESAEEMINKWEKDDRFAAPHFSLTDVIRSLNIPKIQAREIVQKWEDEGLIASHCKIKDESLTRYIFAKRRSEK
jgi:hypothetical protein